MKREQAEKIATEYLKPIYGFALKRCTNLQDAEDLTQEIVLHAFRALLVKDDVDSPDKFIWTVAHNALANYYRNKANTVIGVPIDELADMLPSGDDIAAGVIEKQSAGRLHREIAYLSKQQRRIVIAYYFENKKQEAIAEELGIPLGTVKWHLFEAKKELKRGMDTMRQASELKFNPIKFALCGFSGSTGTKGTVSSFFRSPLSQNIEYAVWKEAKTVNEIADALGVSPVYVESEAEYLEEYGFLTKHRDKYLCNILLDEPTVELQRLHDEMYRKAAEIFANELYDELTVCGILDDPDILGGATEPFTLADDPPKDKNFMLWTLIPYLAALSGESLMDKSITFEDACTIRPDGGKNICYASVLTPDVPPPMYFESMKRFCGPCWNGLSDKFILWTIDSEWSGRRVTENYQAVIQQDLMLLDHFLSGIELSDEEYAYLTERGYISVIHDSGNTKAVLRCLYLPGTEIRNRLIEIGDRIKKKYRAEMQALKAPYIKAVLEATPRHLHTMQKYGLQYLFFSDGWFILHCLKELVNNGKLKPPAEEQKQSLTTILFPAFTSPNEPQ